MAAFGGQTPTIIVLKEGLCFPFAAPWVSLVWVRNARISLILILFPDDRHRCIPRQRPGHLEHQCMSRSPGHDKDDARTLRR